MSKKYTFREITAKEDLEQLFKLRYKVYADCELAPFLNKNDHQLDMDIYDLHARFFGIYSNDCLIAGARVVVEKTENYNPTVYEIGNRYKFYNGNSNSHKKLKKHDIPDFPFLNYPGIPQGVKQFYENQRKDKKVYNVCRCVIDPVFRGLKTIQFLTEGIAIIITLLCGEQVGLSISDVSFSHSKFYSRYGYSPIKDAPTYSVNGITAICLAMYLSTTWPISSVPQHLHPKFAVMLEEYRKTRILEREI
jgi:hypothetical protein